MAQPGYITSTTGTSGTSPLTITNPGAQAGDVLIAAIGFWESGLATLTVPSGWTTIQNDNNARWVGYKIAGSSEPASYSWSNSGSVVAAAGAIALYRNTDPTTPINATAFNTASSATSLTVNATTTLGGCLVVGAFAATANQNSALTGSWTQRANPSKGYTTRANDWAFMLLEDTSQASAGSISETVTSYASANMLGALIALAPVQTGTLTGTITDANTGLPVSGATVSLNDPGSHSTTTDASGNYTLSGVTAGAYTATISKTGYVTATESVTITAGSTATGNDTLTPSVVEVDGSATLKQASTLTATATRLRTAAVTIKQASTLSATATVIRSTSAALKQASALTGTAIPIRTGSLTAAQASELTVTAIGVRTAAANLAQAATLVATAEKIPGGGQAFLKQASTLSANASVIAAASTHAANSLSAPDDLTQAAWVASGLTATANSVTAPNGQLTAGTLIESATSGLHFTGQTVTTPAGSLVSLGITAKASGRTRFQLTAIDGGGHNIGVATFDLSTGAVVSLTAGAISARTDDLGSGWYRCSLLTMTTDTTTGLRLFLLNPSANYPGDGVSGIDVWQAGLSLVEPLAQASSLTATATRVQSSGATLEQASELTASGVRVRLGVASLEQATTLAATATRVVLTSADLKQAASLSVTASATLSGVAALAQASDLAASASALRVATATLKQATTLTAAAEIIIPPPGSGDGRTLAVFVDSGQTTAALSDGGRTSALSGGSASATFDQDGRTSVTSSSTQSTRTKASWTS